MDILSEAGKFAKEQYQLNDPLHQWTHIQNVMNRALLLSKYYPQADLELLKLAIIFHDIDYRSYEAHVEASIEAATRFLEKRDYPKEKISKVKEIMLDHSTPHRKTRGGAKTIEGKLLYDADKSIFINKENYEKYYPFLYLKETKKLVDQSL